MDDATKESKRIEVLYNYELLDTPQEHCYNKLTDLAAKIFNVPIVLITLVDTHRIWFKSHHGLGVSELKREPGFCSSAILSDEVYLVENARQDPRSKSNSFVTGDIAVQFYAGAPLTTKEGYNLGTFCILDKRQRYINSDQQLMLKEMASIVVEEMEVRFQLRKLMKAKTIN